MSASVPASASACPVDHTALAGGCPVSANAAAFDPFGPAYQADPAESLRWSRDEEPVFYSPELGYWVVTRYEDVKAVFRDNLVFSPAIALEKITPVSEEATATLARYDYAMARTLVNEDEPAHMPRRRALMDPFTPKELAHHEAMVRRLTREYVDRFVESGKADLVDEMLWEVPLTVALHFLGVPEEDMATMRKYSIAHTVNTWGRPAPEEQVAVAEAVGRFWQYAGTVLEKMRQDPSGHGWMPYGIRMQQQMPDVVTDSYLHSMMMAGIVAAHETTANASANAFKLLLENRPVWEEICADPSLIPNAVEECLRHSGSVAAWRRVATTDTRIGDVDIPAGAKLLVVNASANHDERHFDRPDEFDIRRPNSSDHLTFGYGSHQCMGKNLARMEMQIFLEELTTRLPHMELVPDQEFTYLPNTSFRGPDHVWVQWDPQANPERTDPAVLQRQHPVTIGEPSTRSVSRTVTVERLDRIADDVLRVVLRAPAGNALPAWTPGAHIDVDLGALSRQYSLCGAPDAPTYEIAVLLDPESRGGSRYVHEQLRVGGIAPDSRAPEPLRARPRRRALRVRGRRHRHHPRPGHGRPRPRPGGGATNCTTAAGTVPGWPISSGSPGTGTAPPCTSRRKAPGSTSPPSSRRRCPAPRSTRAGPDGCSPDSRTRAGTGPTVRCTSSTSPRPSRHSTRTSSTPSTSTCATRDSPCGSSPPRPSSTRCAPTTSTCPATARKASAAPARSPSSKARSTTATPCSPRPSGRRTGR